MFAILRSLWAWGAISVLVLVWLPLLALMRLFDRDPVHYRTGRMFRRLGVAMTLVNPAWRVTVSGFPIPRERLPFVVVSNHQSLADIPLISHLPWEMKWVGKEELFKIPVIGWMMHLSSDISVNRGDARSGAKTLIRALRVLENRCHVLSRGDPLSRRKAGKVHGWSIPSGPSCPRSGAAGGGGGVT
jgi:1-acyl-sn-glycerol-3-phosphate acyltransferase